MAESSIELLKQKFCSWYETPTLNCMNSSTWIAPFNCTKLKHDTHLFHKSLSDKRHPFIKKFYLFYICEKKNNYVTRDQYYE